MGKLTDDIKAEHSGYFNPNAMIIEQKLNKLFYVTPNYPEELRMLKLQKQQAQQYGDRYGLHCSSIIASEKEFCYREQVLSLFYKQLQGSNIPIGLKRIFMEGNYIGEKWQRMFVSGGMGKKEDMDISRFNPKYDLSYTPDAIIRLGGFDIDDKMSILGVPWVVEIKSQNTFSFKKDKGHPSGTKQLRMYMFLERIKHGFVLVEDKNLQCFKILIEIYGETFTKQDVMPYIERLEGVQAYKREFIENKVMVARKNICDSPSCKRASKCNMRDACWNVGMGRVKL